MVTNEELKQLRNSVREIRASFIQNTSKYGLFASNENAWKAMDKIWDDSKSIEDNALAIYDIFNKRSQDLRWVVIEMAEKKHIKDWSRSKRDKIKYRRSIYQSCEQSGKRCCGHNVELFISYILTKKGISNEKGKDRHDIVISSNGFEHIVAIKHTIREKSNDNQYSIKFCWGYPNNKQGGFTRQGFENWTENRDHIHIVVHPVGRAGVNRYSKRLGIEVDILSIDEGILAIKKQLSQTA